MTSLLGMNEKQDLSNTYSLMTKMQLNYIELHVHQHTHTCETFSPGET